MATMLYQADNNDAYPHGNRCYGYGTGSNSVVDPYAWPMQLLRCLGGYRTNVQPLVYVCPSELGIATNWAFQMHFHINRYLPSDNLYSVRPRRGAEVRQPSRYWLFIEKGTYDYCSFKIGYMRNPILPSWNVAPGWPQYRRHHGDMCSVAADASFFETFDLTRHLALARLHPMGRRNALVWSPHTWNTNTNFHS